MWIKISPEQINRDLTSEEAKDPDCECMSSLAVRLWWLTEKPGRESWGSVFQSSHNKILAPAVLNSFLSQIVVATKYKFFTVVYRGIFSQSLWNRSICCTASSILIYIFLLRQDSRANSCHSTNISMNAPFNVWNALMRWMDSELCFWVDHLHSA